MMTGRYRWIAAGLTGLALIIATAHAGAAESAAREAVGLVTRIDFNACEPYQVQAKVMEVRPGKGTFVVAEREVFEMDAVSGTERLRTRHFDLAGNPVEKLRLRAGQFLSVKGFLQPDGHVVAAEIRAIEKPELKRAPYKPVTKARKASRSTSRVNG
jgi:hypothetical protein